MNETPDIPSTPRTSATILLLRDGPAGLEVLMQQRHEEVGVFAGALAFPGGKVMPDDSSPQVRARADGVETHSDDELAFAASAVRECFEECGVLLARETADGPIVSGDRAAATFGDREALDAGELALGDFLENHDLRLALDLMTPWSHWITPVFVPRRFDTWFYLAAVPEGQTADAESNETVEMIWIRPQDALKAAEAGERSLYFATRLNVAELALFDNVDAAIAHARQKTIAIAMPERVEMADGGYMLRLGEEAGYGLWEVPLPVAAGQKPMKGFVYRSAT
jgi:8-oxo-dGTP pyrophosphatase MutT (NUDIX family)